MDSFDTYQYEDKPAVCITHLRFIPCRRTDGCEVSDRKDHAQIVADYQFSKIEHDDAVSQILLSYESSPFDQRREEFAERDHEAEIERFKELAKEHQQMVVDRIPEDRQAAINHFRKSGQWCDPDNNKHVTPHRGCILR